MQKPPFAQTFIGMVLAAVVAGLIVHHLTENRKPESQNNLPLSSTTAPPQTTTAPPSVVVIPPATTSVLVVPDPNQAPIVHNHTDLDIPFEASYDRLSWAHWRMAPRTQNPIGDGRPIFIRITTATEQGPLGVHYMLTPGEDYHIGWNHRKSVWDVWVGGDQ
jgi:hypothetical protein